jgi:hypothetical protein
VTVEPQDDSLVGRVEAEDDETITTTTKELEPDQDDLKSQTFDSQ